VIQIGNLARNPSRTARMVEALAVEAKDNDLARIVR
jgi:hypothetical protein